MTSELNFPIGDSVKLDMADDRTRWLLPMHLFDLVSLATGRSKVQGGDPAKAYENELVTELRQLINRGKDRNMMYVDGSLFYLLDKKRAYFSRVDPAPQSMLEIMARSAKAFLVNHHVHQSRTGETKLEDQAILTYLTVKNIPSIYNPKYDNPSGAHKEDACAEELDQRDRDGLKSFFAALNNKDEWHPWQRKLLVLARSWLHVYLPHCEPPLRFPLEPFLK